MRIPFCRRGVIATRSRRLVALLLLPAVMSSLAHAALVNVYLMSGQSNMEGQGLLSDLSPAEKTPPANTYFWTGSAFQALVPGTTVTGPSGKFGPEIAFASAMASPDQSTYIIKSYRGGTALDAGWSDQTYVGGTGANRYNFYAGTSAADPNRGLSYIAMMTTFKAALQAIVTSGNTPVIQGMLWMQGEQDTKNLTSANAYAANLVNFVSRVKQDLSLTTLPFVYGQAAPGTLPVSAYVYRTELRDSQAAAQSLISGSKMVSTDGYPVNGAGDPAHYNAAGQLRLGSDFATAMKSLQAVPEPGTYGLLGAATLVTAAVVRRRKPRR